MTLQTLISRYTAFAILATLANLGIQRIILGLGDGWAVFGAALVVGTGVGLVVKYLLDKRWIFHDVETGLKAHGRKFTLYTAMGLVTTAIFWGTQTAFWRIWQTDTMALVGGAIGLSIGYVVKYNLDRRFVFTDGRLEPAA